MPEKTDPGSERLMGLLRQGLGQVSGFMRQSGRCRDDGDGARTGPRKPTGDDAFPCHDTPYEVRLRPDVDSQE